MGVRFRWEPLALRRVQAGRLGAEASERRTGLHELALSDEERTAKVP